MKAIKKISLILCLAVLVLTGMTACDNTKTEQKLDGNEVSQIGKNDDEDKSLETRDKSKKTRTIIDHVGNNVEVPEKVKASMKSFYKNQKFTKI